MEHYYYYLISSLPTLKRDDTPYHTVASFTAACAEHISSSELKILNDLSLVPAEDSLKTAAHGSFTSKWYEWETYFRNRLSKLRTVSLDRGSNKFLRPLDEKLMFPEIDRVITEQLLSAEPAEKEKTLDNLRWTKLDEFELGHYFDFDILCSYKLKLLIREKWLKRDLDKGMKNLNEIVNKIYSE